MPPRFNSEQFQNKVIDVNSVLLEAASHFNFGSNRQMRWWWYYFQKYEYVPAEMKQYRRTSKYMGKKKKASQWTPTHLRIFEELIEYDLDLYLDEIVFGN